MCTFLYKVQNLANSSMLLEVRIVLMLGEGNAGNKHGEVLCRGCNVLILDLGMGNTCSLCENSARCTGCTLKTVHGLACILSLNKKVKAICNPGTDSRSDVDHSRLWSTEKVNRVSWDESSIGENRHSEEA